MKLDLSALWQQAAIQFEAGQYEAAADSCKRLIALMPEKPMAYSLMSKMWHQRGRVRPATLNAFYASRRLVGSHWKDVLSVSSDLLAVGEIQLAHGVLSFINPHDPANCDALLELGRQYSTLEDQPRALYCIEQAMANGQNGPFAQHMLGIVLSFTGPIERAIVACENSARAKPTYGHASWSCAQFGRRDGAKQRVARMRAALRLPDLSNDDVSFLNFGLFKELDTLDRTTEAWAALMEGAMTRRRITKYHAETENAAFDSLIDVTPGSFLDGVGDVPADATPIFIVGMPRTGTTLLERILGNHPLVTTCGELNDFKQQMQWVNDARLPQALDGDLGAFVSSLDYTVLGRRYLEKTRWLTGGRAYYSDKHPMNFMWCGMILKAVPHAKIIHLRRHPMDSCFSNLKELFAKGFYPYSYVLEELANHYRNYDRLMRHWHAIAPGRILDVRYEDLVARPEHETLRVENYLGLPNVEGLTDILANKKITTTASTLQLRQPIHRGNVGAWRRYEAGLAPLLAMLEPYSEAYESN